MSGKKKLFFCRTRAVRCVIGTPIQLQHFFFSKKFFFGGKWGKIFFDPPGGPGYPRLPRVPCPNYFAIWAGRNRVLMSCEGCPTQVKFAEPRFFFYFDQNGLDLFEQIFGSTVGTFSKP
jgi:hypothetical protein